jgi:hypothetical protein
MIRITAGCGRKAPGPEEYSSRSFNASMEVEVPDALAGDRDGLKKHMAGMFDTLKQAVDDHIEAARNGSNGDHQERRPREEGRPSNGNGNGARKATRAQVRAIHAITRRIGGQVADLVREKFSMSNPEELTIGQASDLIESLKEEVKR